MTSSEREGGVYRLPGRQRLGKRATVHTYLEHEVMYADPNGWPLAMPW